MSKKFVLTRSMLGMIVMLFLASCDPNGSVVTPDTPSDTTSVDMEDTVLLNVAYGTHAKQMMDIYLPGGRNGTTPVIILIHGGGWSAGDKAEMTPFVNKVESRWPEAAIVNLNYRLANGSTVTHTQITDDIRSALAYLTENKTELIISDEYAMIGGSAGAHLAMLYAYKYDELEQIKAVANFFGVTHLADWEYYNSFNIVLGQVKDVMKTYVGEYWNEEVYKSLSPYRIVSSSHYRPTITFHGSADVVVPSYQGGWMKARLDELGLESKYFLIDGQGHGFDEATYNDCFDKTISFFKENW